MRNISPQLLAAFGAESYSYALLVYVGGTNKTYTSWATAVGGEPRAMKPKNIKYSNANIVDSFDCIFDDTDMALFNAHQQINPSMVEHSLIVKIAAISSETISAESIAFLGNYSEWSYSSQEFTIKALSVLDRLRYPTNRISSSSCQVKKFKDQYCGYTGGATSCNRTYEQCFQYLNEDNFRGFRWLPTLTNKKIRFST